MKYIVRVWQDDDLLEEHEYLSEDEARGAMSANPGITATLSPVRHATHVVVDTIDGYTFWNDSTGLMTEQTARAFAETRNAEMKPAYQTYKVFRLEEV